jgi:hypothetical protein
MCIFLFSAPVIPAQAGIQQINRTRIERFSNQIKDLGKTVFRDDGEVC